MDHPIDPNREKIEKIIKDIEQLPTLPTIHTRLNKMIANPKSTAHSVSRIIEEDQALTAKILKIINSAFYSFPQRIATISHAVVILGFNEIKNIALAAAVIDLFPTGDSNYTFNHEAFWAHSLGVAICSRIIAKKVGTRLIKDPEEAFTAGLTHDIGKLVEDQFMHDEFTKILENSSKQDIPLIKSERFVLGFTHQEVGKFLAEKWNLPFSFIEIAGYHNTPGDKQNPLLAIVHLANIFVHTLEIGFSGDDFIPQFNSNCWDQLGLTLNQIDSIMKETVDAYEEVSTLVM